MAVVLLQYKAGLLTCHH